VDPEGNPVRGPAEAHASAGIRQAPPAS
jgi:hypothetical protein